MQTPLEWYQAKQIALHQPRHVTRRCSGCLELKQKCRRLGTDAGRYCQGCYQAALEGRRNRKEEEK